MNALKIFISIFCGVVVGGVVAESNDQFWLYGAMVGAIMSIIVRLSFEPELAKNLFIEMRTDFYK